MNTYQVRYRVPYCDKEQYVYGFKLKTIHADSEDSAKGKLECLAFDIRIQKIPNDIPARKIA